MEHRVMYEDVQNETANDGPLGVGIVGVGGIAVSHIASLTATPRAELVAIADVDGVRAAAAARQAGCNGYDSVDALLRDPAVDAVIVCTPNMTHEAIGSAVIGAGKHLLMEKPLALTLEGSQRLADEAAAAGVVLAVGHSHRFSDQSLQIKNVIDSGAIGTPRFVRIIMNGGWIWPGWQAWVLNPALSGGHSLHNGVHIVDLASWWIGEEATSVFAAGQAATSAALQIADYLVIELGFGSGAAAVVEVSRGERPRDMSMLQLTVVGTEGVVSREFDAEGVLAWTDSGLAAWSSDAAHQRSSYFRELESFVTAARGDGDVNPPVRAAVHAVDLAVAAERSLATGDTVQIGADS